MNNKVKVGDKVLIKFNSSRYFTPCKPYIVKKVYDERIHVMDDTNNAHHISAGNYEVVTNNTDTDMNIINAYNLIGKKVKDGRTTHTITKISIWVKGVSDKEANVMLSTVSHTKLNTLNNGGILIILHDNGYNFPYENHVEMNQIDVKLNDTYTATVSKDSIVVGCQTFSPSILKELSEAYDKLK